MTDTVNLSPGHRGTPRENAITFKSGALTNGWIVPVGDTLISTYRDDVEDGPHNAFNHTNTDGFEITIDSGEAVVEGAPLCRDVGSTVTLQENVNQQIVYVGWAHNATDTVRVGLDAAFNEQDAQLPIWQFNTDSAGVTNDVDLRNIGHTIDVENQYYNENPVGDATNVTDTIDGVDIGNFARRDRQTEVFDGDLRVHNNNGIINTDESDRVSWYPRRNIGYYDRPNDIDTGTYPSAFEVVTGMLWSDGNSSILMALSPDQGLQLNTSVDFRGEEATGFVIENRNDRPSNPEPGQLIFRTDK